MLSQQGMEPAISVTMTDVDLYENNITDVYKRQAVRSSLSFMLKRAGYEVKTAPVPREAMDIVKMCIRDRSMIAPITSYISYGLFGLSGMMSFRESSRRSIGSVQST